jgi:hypothetical protein
MKIKNVLMVFLLLTGILSFRLLANNSLVSDKSSKSLEHAFPSNIESFSPPDTSVQLQEGDTIAEYTAGGDSVYVLYEDSIPDSSFTMAWEIPYPTEHMIIELTNHHLPVEEGLFGVNVTDMFQTGFANEDDMPGIYGANPDPWDYLTELKPKILRFPSGAGGKFYQPLGSTRTNPDGPGFGFINGGYGINIDEVIRFYDVTDNLPSNAPDLYDVIGDPGFTSIEEDMVDGNCNLCNTWMSTEHTETFEDNYNKWASQPIIDPTGITGPADMGTDLYVNQFINLVQQIENDPDNLYTVDVVVCLNISTETATESVRLIEYLVNSGINVVAVEIGNEVYFTWGREMMGFTDQVSPDDPISPVSPFIHYWDYINGHNYAVGTTGEDVGDGIYGDAEFDLTSTVPADVLADHDYITAINTTFPDIKIGLPGENFNQCEEIGWDTPFIVDDPDDQDQSFLPGGPEPACPCNYSDWNLDMETKFDKTIAVGESTGSKFDAIILHTYYNAGNAYADCPDNTNWQVAATEPTFALGTPYGDQWTFSPFDPNIGPLFEGIAGIATNPDGGTPTYKIGNFKEFTRDRIKEAYDQHALNLNFLDGDPGPTKEIWITEYNIGPKPKGLTADADEPYVNMVPGTFAHCVALQNWMLWHVKSYYDSDYKPGIVTMATTQAFIGGNPIDYMTPSIRNDQVQLEIPNPSLTCTVSPPDETANFFVTRAPYFTAQLLNTIHTLDLNYEKTFIGMYSQNNNIAPTSFVQLNNEGEPINLYVFYTNIKQTTQRYAIDPADIYLSIEDAGGVELGPATIYALNPSQLYSTAGRSAMFVEPINSAYGCRPDPPGAGLPIDLPYPYEITDTWTGISGTGCPGGFTPPMGGVCVTVPATSAGYFIVPITPTLRKGEIASTFTLYPNPADNFFVIQKTSTNADVADNFNMKIFSTFGALVLETSVRSGEMVNTDKLPSGMYTVVITDSNNYSSTLKFSKMQ